MPAQPTPLPPTDPLTPPRARGSAWVTTKARAGATVLDRFRTSGSLKVVFPQTGADLTGILVNTAGGLTSGDRFDVAANVGAGNHLTLSTQAAERAYRASTGPAQVRTVVDAGPGATVQWVPQETLLFDGCHVQRDLTLRLDATARCLMVEPLVFGRTAMGEVVHTGTFRDRILIEQDGLPIYRDGVHLSGDIQATLARAAVAGGAGAMAQLVFVHPGAAAHLGAVRRHLPDTGGASLLRPNVLVARILAQDSFLLRQSLLPILDRLSDDTLPKTWRL